MKRVKLSIVILFVILVSIVAFFGIYKKENGVWKNLVPDYEYGMDVKGARELIYALDETEEEKYVYVDEEGNSKGEVWKDGSSITQEEEETPQENEEGQNAEENATEESEEIPYSKETRTIKVNEDSSLTKENFEKAKKIIQERLKEQEVGEYYIRIDDVTGKLVIETVNDDKTVELVEELVSKPGKFEIIDYQNGVKLMDNSDIKNASVVYSNNSSYNTYLQIEFNKAGAEKLREISNKYVEIKDENEEESEEPEEATEEENAEEETERKFVSMIFDGNNMLTTYFGEEMTSGLLQLAVGEERDNYEEFMEDYASAKTLADILNSGILPVTYELETDNFVKSEVLSDLQKISVKVVCILTLAIASALFIIKFKKNGAIGAILNIGYIAIFILTLKYTNVEITTNAIVTAIIMVILNIAFIKMILKQLQTEEIGQVYVSVSKKFYLASIPIMVIAFAFTLTKYYAINSIGMVVFWGIVLNVLYHLILTRNVFDREDDKNGNK